jgi:hypothetical protein
MDDGLDRRLSRRQAPPQDQPDEERRRPLNVRLGRIPDGIEPLHLLRCRGRACPGHLAWPCAGSILGIGSRVQR